MVTTFTIPKPQVAGRRLLMFWFENRSFWWIGALNVGVFTLTFLPPSPIQGEAVVGWFTLYRTPLSLRFAPDCLRVLQWKPTCCLSCQLVVCSTKACCIYVFRSLGHHPCQFKFAALLETKWNIGYIIASSFMMWSSYVVVKIMICASIVFRYKLAMSGWYLWKHDIVILSKIDPIQLWDPFRSRESYEQLLCLYRRGCRHPRYFSPD